MSLQNIRLSNGIHLVVKTEFMSTLWNYPTESWLDSWMLQNFWVKQHSALAVAVIHVIQVQIHEVAQLAQCLTTWWVSVTSANSCMLYRYDVSCPLQDQPLT